MGVVDVTKLRLDAAFPGYAHTERPAVSEPAVWDVQPLEAR